MKLKKLFLVFFLYFIIAVILTFPLVLKINNSYGTTYGTDSEFYIWNLWKFKYDILEAKTNPLIGHDVSIFYPVGYLKEATGYDSLINMVFGLFLQFFLNPIATYNVLVLFNFALAALATFILIDYFVKESKISFLCGIIFGFSPFMFARSLGHLNVLTTGWMVFFIYFFIRMVKEKKMKFSVLAAIFYFLTAISFWYYAIFALFFIGFVLIYITLRKTLRKKIFNKVFLKNFILFSILSIFLVSMVALPFVILTIKKQTASPPLDNLYVFSATIFSYFVPPPYISLIGKIMRIDPLISLLSGNIIEFTSFMGFLEIAVFLFFISNYPKSEKKRILIIFVITFFILSLGPYLKPTHIPLPYKIFTFFPFLNFVRSINRLSIFVYMGMALIFALFLKEIFKHLSQKKKKIILALSFVLILFERLFLPFPLQKFSLPSFYQDIKNQKGDFAILDLPSGYHEKYNLLQTVHEKNIVMGTLIPTALSPKIIKEVFENPFIQFSFCFPIFPEWTKKTGLYSGFHKKPPEQLSREELFKKLKLEKILYVVIHKDIIKNCPEVEKRMNEYFSNVPSYFEDTEIKVFKTNP